MPLEKVSRGFKDLSATFSRNPLTDDLILLKNEVAIARSIRNLVMTFNGERFFQPEIGSRVSRLLFDNMSPILADQIKDEISTTIGLNEPRVELNDINCIPNYDGNEYEVTIRYTIIGLDISPQELNFVLQPTR
jgi:phage baseplate assembly protein W